MHICRSIVIPFTLLFFIQINLRGQEYVFKTFSNEDEKNPLPKSAITFITQDADGFIWMAPYGSGVSRYDGSVLVDYNKKDGIASDIFAMRQDSLSRLWCTSGSYSVMASEKPLNEYGVNDSIRFVRQIDSIALPKRKGSYAQTDIAVDTKGNIWTSLDSFIFKIHYDSEGKISIDTVFTDRGRKDITYYFSPLAVQPDGKILFLNTSNEIKLYDDDTGDVQTITLEHISDSIVKNQLVQNAFLSPDGALYIITNRLFVLMVDLKKSNKATIIKSLSGKGVKSIQFLKDKLFISTTGNGLLYYDPNTQTVIKKLGVDNGLPSDIIWNTFYDQGGNLWISTNSGVARISDDFLAFGHYSDKNKVLASKEANNVKTHIFLDQNDKSSDKELIAVSSQSGLSILNKSGESKIINTRNGLRTNSILSCIQDSKGRIFVVTTKGVDCIAPSKSLLKEAGVKQSKAIEIFGRQLYIGPTLMNASMQSAESFFLPKSNENQVLEEAIWFIGREGAWVLVGPKWIFISKEAGLIGTFYNNAAIDDEGHIYFSDSHKGIFRSSKPLTIQDLLTASIKGAYNDNIQFQAMDSFFEQFHVTYQEDTIKSTIFVKYIDGKLWSSSDKGLAAIDLDTRKIVKLINQRTPKANFRPTGFIADPNHPRLWAVGTGMYSVNTQSLELEKEILAKDGLVSQVTWGLPGIDVDMDGRFYYATNKGLSMYTPSLDKVDTTPPNARVTSMHVDYPTLYSNEVDLQYTGLSYGRESSVLFKTKLIGYDEDWSQESSATKIRYTNLSAYLFPKKYEFQVKAVDVHGNWQTVPNSVNFTIKPVFYLHWLAVLLYAVLLYLFVKWYTRYRTKQLLKKQEELENTVKERTAEVVAEKNRSEELLLNILPAETAEELKAKGYAKAKNYDHVTVIFTDFKGFSAFAKDLQPEELIKEIDFCFRAFDEIMGKYGVEKIKTIGDAYMAVSGLPTAKENHAQDAIAAAFEIRDFMVKYKQEKDLKSEMAFEMRIGLHTGPVVAGIVGIKKFAYDIWGDTVNIASRMESNGAVNKINISEETYIRLKDDDQFAFESRGKTEVKNRGELEMYFIEKI